MKISIFDRNLLEIMVGTLVATFIVVIMNKYLQIMPLPMLVLDLLIGSVCYLLAMTTMKNEYIRRAYVFVAHQMNSIR